MGTASLHLETPTGRWLELVLLGVGAWRSLGDGRCWLIVLELVGAGLGCVSRYTGGVGCARGWCRRGVRQGVCAVVMVRGPASGDSWSVRCRWVFLQSWSQSGDVVVGVV